MPKKEIRIKTCARSWIRTMPLMCQEWKYTTFYLTNHSSGKEGKSLHLFLSAFLLSKNQNEHNLTWQPPPPPLPLSRKFQVTTCKVNRRLFFQSHPLPWHTLPHPVLCSCSAGYSDDIERTVNQLMDTICDKNRPRWPGSSSKKTFLIYIIYRFSHWFSTMQSGWYTSKSQPVQPADFLYSPTNAHVWKVDFMQLFAWPLPLGTATST